MAGIYLEAEDFDQEYLIWCGDLNPDTLLGNCRYVGAPGRAGPTPASDGTATTLQSLITTPWPIRHCYMRPILMDLKALQS